MVGLNAVKMTIIRQSSLQLGPTASQYPGFFVLVSSRVSPFEWIIKVEIGNFIKKVAIGVLALAAILILSVIAAICMTAISEAISWVTGGTPSHSISQILPGGSYVRTYLFVPLGLILGISLIVAALYYLGNIVLAAVEDHNDRKILDKMRRHAQRYNDNY